MLIMTPCTDKGMEQSQCAHCHPNSRPSFSCMLPLVDVSQICVSEPCYNGGFCMLLDLELSQAQRQLTLSLTARHRA